MAVLSYQNVLNQVQQMLYKTIQLNLDFYFQLTVIKQVKFVSLQNVLKKWLQARAIHHKQPKNVTRFLFQIHFDCYYFLYLLHHRLRFTSTSSLSSPAKAYGETKYWPWDLKRETAFIALFLRW